MIAGDTKTPLAVYWKVDFAMEQCVVTIDPQFNEERVASAMEEQEFLKRARHQNNVIAEYAMDLRVRKRRTA